MPSYRSLVIGLLTIVLLPFDAAAHQSADALPEALRALRAERNAIEMRIELLRRMIPAEFHFESETEHARKMAKEAEIELSAEAIAGSESIATDAGAAPFRMHRVRYRGAGPLDAIGFWLELVAIRDWRMTDLDVLTIERAENGTPRFVAEFICPIWPFPTTPPPAWRDPVAQLRAEVDRDRAVERSLNELHARTKDGRLARAAALLDAIDESDALRITHVKLADAVEMRGVVIGAAARASLLDAIRSSNLGIERLAMPRRGACRPFSIVARAGIDDAADRHVEDKSDRDLGALCGAAPLPASKRVTARGTGPFSIHLRSVQLTDAGFVLHDLTGQSFIVDRDVDALIDVDLEKVTPDEVLTAFRSAGFFIGPGPLHRISKVAHTPPAGSFSGEPVSLIFRDAALGPVLCIFQEITALEVKMPADSHARISIFADQMPWDLALENVIASAGLSYAIDGMKLYVGSLTALASAASRPQSSACEANDADDGAMRPLLAAAHLDSTDIVLAGTAATADGWRAYTRLTWPPLFRIDKDAKLVDSTITSIERDGVSVKMRSGEVVKLPIQQ
ncbi:MAG: hypothetical protein ACYC7A_18430 [Thermoanaerobaculia bacterium]